MNFGYGNRNKYYDKMKEQYAYARESIESIKKVNNGLDITKPKETYSTIMVSKLFEFVKRLIYLGALFFIFTMVFRNVNFIFLINSNSLIIKASTNNISSILKKQRTLVNV